MKYKYPLAVSSNIVVQELQDEVLVYDLEKNNALRLNESSAFIWKNCDGKNDIKDLTRLANDKFKTTFNEEFIEFGLDELLKSNLIQNYARIPQSTVSRRKALLNMALPIAMLPIVTGILAPLSVQAQSVTCATGAAFTCSVDTDCNNANTPDCSVPGCSCGNFSCVNNCCQAGNRGCN